MSALPSSPSSARARGYGRRIAAPLALLLAILSLPAFPQAASATPAPVSLIVPATSSVWASSAYPGAPPDFAFDCNPGSPWNAGGYGGSLFAQFTQPITFNGIQLSVSALPSTAESYTFNGSNDGTTWTPITSTSVFVPQGNPTLPLVTFPAVTYSYLSIDVNGGASWVAILDARLQVAAASNVPSVATCGTSLPLTNAQLNLKSTTPNGGTVAAGPPPTYSGSATFTATLNGAASPAGLPVTFTVSGANPQTLTATTDATGTATAAYTGTSAGTDSIVASTEVDAATIATDPWLVTWGTSPPIITDLVAGEYVAGGGFVLTGTTVPGGHIRCTHNAGGEIWETDADASGAWSLQVNLGGGDGEDILYVEDGSGGGYFNLYAGGAGGFPVVVDGSDSGPDFHLAGSAGGGGQNLYLGDLSVGLQPIAPGLGGGAAIRRIVWSATGDDVVDWTTVDGGPCGCVPDGTIVFHRVGSRTLSYYVIDEFGHRGPIRHRLIRNQAPLSVSNVTASPGAFSTALAGGDAGHTTITYRLSSPGIVTVRIFDGSGALLRTLISGASRPAGDYTSGDTWDGTNDAGGLVGSCGCRVEVDAVDPQGNVGSPGYALISVNSTPGSTGLSVPSDPAAPVVGATPELDSLALFGTAASGLGGYLLFHFKGLRRPRRGGRVGRSNPNGHFGGGRTPMSDADGER